MWKKIFIFIIILVWSLSAMNLRGGALKIARAAETGSVVINEIGWMGSETSSADEWVELYNNTQEDIDLAGWKLTAQDGKPDIILEGVIPAKGFFLIERTDDDSALDAPANFITSFGTGLGNGGEVLKLYDMDEYLIDSTPVVGEDVGWMAGDNESKATMERIDPMGFGDNPDNWQTSAMVGGTPSKENSQGAETSESPSGDSDGTDDAAADGEEGEGEGEEGEPASASSDADALADKEAAAGEEEKEEKDGAEGVEGEEGIDGINALKSPFEGRIYRKGRIVPGKIIINEIFPNPNGSDFEEEFIELKNIGGQEINAGGWIIKNKTNQYKISSNEFKVTIIPSGGFLALPRSITNLALNNSGDKIEIFSGDEKRKDSISYNEYAQENESYIYVWGEWLWSSAITPGAENFHIASNRAPHPFIDSKGIKEIFVGEELILDGSDSFDPDGDELSFFWKTSDGAEMEDVVLKKSFSLPGEYKINFKVVDKFANESSAEIKIKVLDDWKKGGNSGFIDGTEQPILYQENFEDIEIAEILPNPEGSDNGEWIKIYNNEDYAVSLNGWILDDEDGGSKPYQIPADVIIKAKNEFIFEKSKTGVALNNDGDEARLFSPDGELKNKIIYGKVSEGEIVENLEIRNWKFGNSEIGDIEGEEIKKFEIGDWEFEGLEGEEIIIEGYVSAKPGVLGKQVLYLTDGVRGIEVYCWAKDFPELETGDFITVAGELLSDDGWRIKISEKADIQVLSYEHPPLAVEKAVEDLKDENINSLIMVKGQIVEKNNPNLYLDDGKNEIKVYIMDGANIEVKELKVGDFVSIIGILDYMNGSYRLLPRGAEDVKLEEGRVLGAQSEVDEAETMSGSASMSESIESTDNNNNAPDQGRNTMIIFLSLTLAALAVIGGIVWRRSARES